MERWWNYGEYTGGDCPNCGRNRLLACTDNDKKDRIVCEKCRWEPALNSYCPDIDE